MNKTLLLIQAAAVAALVACAGCRSSSSTTVNPAGSAGQQLMDLKKARDTGLITEKEYERMRKKIVKEND